MEILESGLLKPMIELENLKQLHEAQDSITSLRCRLAGLQGKCLAIIQEQDSPLGLYHPKEVELAKEFESEIDQILNRNKLDQLLS